MRLTERLLFGGGATSGSTLPDEPDSIRHVRAFAAILFFFSFAVWGIMALDVYLLWVDPAHSRSLGFGGEAMIGHGGSKYVSKVAYTRSALFGTVWFLLPMLLSLRAFKRAERRSAFLAIVCFLAWRWLDSWIRWDL